MDHQTSLLKRLTVLFMVIGTGLIALSFLAAALVPSMGKPGRFLAQTLSKNMPHSALFEIYRKSWLEAQAKVDRLRHTEQLNSKLTLENAHLRLSLEAMRFSCHARESAAATYRNELKLNHETGTRVGRTLASISYKVPGNLPPYQLYTLGLTYLEGHEDEKAAAIFSSLTGLEENNSYKTAKNFLITGVAWYRVENYTLADYYFDQTLKQPEKAESLQYQAQARLWKAVIAKKFNKEVKAQFWLKDLIDHHPHATEASWVNPTKEGKGAHASE